MVFANGTPNRDQLDLLFLMDTYLQRPDPRWAELLARAAMTALSPSSGAPHWWPNRATKTA